MDEASVVGSYATVLVFILLFARDTITAYGHQLERELRRLNVNQGEAVRGHSLGFLDTILPQQGVIVGCSVGITLCMVWFLWQVLGLPGVALGGIRWGLAALTIYVLGFVALFTYWHVKAYFGTKADIRELEP